MHRRKVRPEVSPIAPLNSTVAPARGLRVSDAAAYAGVSHWFLRSAIWTGKLKAHRAGKILIVLREDIDAWLNILPEVAPNNAEWLAKRQQAAVQSC